MIRTAQQMSDRQRSTKDAIALGLVVGQLFSRCHLAEIELGDSFAICGHGRRGCDSTLRFAFRRAAATTRATLLGGLYGSICRRLAIAAA
jgi:hypothetical protein